MIEKINPRYIFSDHIRTLRITGKDSVNFADIILFFGIPIVITVLLMILFGLDISDGLAQALFTGLSIFAGLLFNLQILVYDIVTRENEKTNKEEASRLLRMTTLNEVFSNVSYAILIALIVVVLVSISYFTFGGGRLGNSISQICTATSWLCEKSTYKAILDFLVFTLTFNFVLTLLMVLRRVHFLLASEFPKS